MGKVRAEVLISGRVQGVYFRSYLQEKAEELQVTGWTRNLFDGKVEAVFEGEKDKVKALIDWCHQGPSAARVTEVKTGWQEYQGGFNSFTIKY